MANIREIILNILMEYDKSEKRNPTLLKDSLEKYDYLETRDKSFMKRVVDGTLERQIQIDYVLDQFSKTKVAKMQPLIRSLMRMSVYQIMFMDQVPDSAACNEAVKLASKHKFVNLKGFVNGVLRNVSRNKETIEYPSRDKNAGADYLSVIYSMPLWICENFLQRFGFEKTENMLKFFLEPRPTTVRLNRNFFEKVEAVDAFVKELEAAGAVVRKSVFLPYVLELEKTDNIRFLPGFMEGKFTVQDCSSILLTETAQPQPGQTVIDVCAAPGGKSLHAAEKVGDGGRVISRDISERKCDLIRDNADRMGFSNITVEAHDARVHDDSLEEKADVLYLDVPCSGLGIMGRKNDIKYNITEDGIKELNVLQWEIVKSSWNYVRKGGVLMYSTCTVSESENEAMVQRICSELPFEAESQRQILPGENGCDGFFIARLIRKDK